MGSRQILKGVLQGLPRSPSLRVSLVAQSGTVMIVQRESRQCAHRHGGDVIGKSRGEEAGEIQGNRLVSTILLYLLLTYLNSTSIIDIFLSYILLEKLD